MYMKLVNNHNKYGPSAHRIRYGKWTYLSWIKSSSRRTKAIFPVPISKCKTFEKIDNFVSSQLHQSRAKTFTLHEIYLHQNHLLRKSASNIMESADNAEEKKFFFLSLTLNTLKWQLTYCFQEISICKMLLLNNLVSQGLQALDGQWTRIVNLEIASNIVNQTYGWQLKKKNKTFRKSSLVQIMRSYFAWDPYRHKCK